MKHIIILFLLGFSGLFASSQQMKFDWISQAGGPGWDIVTDVTELPDSQIIMVGAFYDEIYFETDTLVSAGSRDIFIARYSPTGTLKKVVSYGGEGYEYVRIAKSSGKSGVVMPVQFNRELNLGGKKFEGTRANNFLISWFDENFKLTNYARIGSSEIFDITNLETAPDGDFYFSGWFTDSLEIENSVYIPKNGRDIFLGKISKHGKLKWFKQFKGDGFDSPFSFTAEKEGVNFMAGITGSGCFGEKMVPSGVTENTSHLFLSRIKNKGEIQSVIYPLKGTHIEPVEMLKDNNSVWIVVNFKYSAFINGVELVSYGDQDVVLIKVDLEDGSVDYCQLGGYGKEKASGLVKSGDNILITGLFTGKLSFAGEEITAGNAGADVFVASVNADCKPENIFTITGEESEFPCSAFALETGIYLAGEFSGELKSGNFELVSAGKEDIFLARIENCSAGNPLNITKKSLEPSSKKMNYELDAGGGFVDYSWDEGVSESRYFTVSRPDKYTVTVTDSLGCVYTREIDLSNTKSARIVTSEESLGERKFSLYPTVTSGKVFWKPSSTWEKGEARVRVFDSTGKQVYRQNIDNVNYQTYSIDFSAEPEGTFLVEISGTGFREVTKVIVKK